MALLNYAKREINAKVVYYGPGLCGKTTNIQYIHRKLNPDSRGKLLSLATQTDRTLFFDFLPVELGEIKGFKTRFHLYTVPGQVFYNATRKMVLKGADGVVFVADSQPDMLDANLESFQNLKDNLAEYGLSLDELPYVIQCNKRDLPNVMPLEEMERLLNKDGVPVFPASAMDGKGVLPTLTTLCKMVLRNLRTSQGLDAQEPGRDRQAGASYKALRREGDPFGTLRPPAAVAPPPTPTPTPTDSPFVPAGSAARIEEVPLAPPPPQPPALVVEGCAPPRLAGQEVVLPLTLRHLGRLRRVAVHLRLAVDGGEPVAAVTGIEEHP